MLVSGPQGGGLSSLIAYTQAVWCRWGLLPRLPAYLATRLFLLVRAVARLRLRFARCAERNTPVKWTQQTQCYVVMFVCCYVIRTVMFWCRLYEQPGTPLPGVSADD